MRYKIFVIDTVYCRINPHKAICPGFVLPFIFRRSAYKTSSDVQIHRFLKFKVH